VANLGKANLGSNTFGDPIFPKGLKNWVIKGIAFEVNDCTKGA
jgi:hypothetical protein